MTDQPPSDNPRRTEDLPFPFNTGYYVAVESLDQEENARIYDLYASNDQDDRAKIQMNLDADRWYNVKYMIEHYEDRKSNILQRAWEGGELETAARLMAWGVPRIVIESIVGWSAVELTADERARMGRIIEHEQRKLRRI
ncbi:hypothetical protein FVEN_g6551 [Fusarium venenatum]|uniref:Uncharacterized protein n=1 Tax=Fusarium venenatum TaxID=56646 RepID=A0A2L2TJH7_9HYPO|nr:uncharacterized protein FVRRES_04846 [Fusarium venenatum]KAG8355756.1 hypothetical protein FVEN_g6551 [Fusarium venenatum]KAH6991982.1 hypothetical protein EDB82DRAFT_553868 [Fusarium venenatum]CEI60410.1 unnamed protein product [Fusarium venenatum]